MQINDFFVSCSVKKDKKYPEKTASIFNAMAKAMVSGNPVPKSKKKKGAKKK